MPVTLPVHLLNKARNSPRCSPLQKAVADLTNIAFFYLLRVGEYAYTTSGKRRTTTFRVRDITFRDRQGLHIPNNSPLPKLLAAHEATLTITNQKNGTKGQTIHHECTGNINSPVHSLARRVHHILSKGGKSSDCIHLYFSGKTRRNVSQRHISTAVKDAAEAIGLNKFGYQRDDVSSHSLRAGGAMAMHLNDIKDTTIMKQGRWKSNTFLMYIHAQISAFASGLSLKMSNEIPFRQIAGPRLNDPAAACA